MTNILLHEKYRGSASENFFEGLEPYIPWILEKTGARHRDELITWYLHTVNDALDETVTSQFRETDFAQKETTRSKSLSREIREAVSNHQIHPSFESLILFLSARSSEGNKFFDGPASVCISSFDVAGNTFVFVKKQVAIPQGDVQFDRCICRKSDLDAILNAFEEVLRRNRWQTVSVYGEGADMEFPPFEWDQLILSPEQTNLIRRDIEMFSGKRKLFLERNIPWRRGYLFHGSPGNGKSSAVKAIITALNAPAATMKSYSGEDVESYFQSMFKPAEYLKVILLEDIDRIFSENPDERESQRNRVNFSTFLNCLDGVGNADGMVVIATANNPRNLDAAVLERPGRFDRVVSFPNPTPDLAVRYLMKLNPTFEEDELNKLSFPGMSYAQIRELYILAWQAAEERGSEEATALDLMVAMKRMQGMLEVKQRPVGLR